MKDKGPQYSALFITNNSTHICVALILGSKRSSNYSIRLRDHTHYKIIRENIYFFVRFLLTETRGPEKAFILSTHPAIGCLRLLPTRLGLTITYGRGSFLFSATNRLSASSLEKTYVFGFLPNRAAVDSADKSSGVFLEKSTDFQKKCWN